MSRRVVLCAAAALLFAMVAMASVAAKSEAETALEQSLTKSYYELLGIERDAEEKDIRKAYRRAALTAHPDKLPPGTSEGEREAQRQVFLRISNAHDVLSDKETRKRYDWLLTRGVVDYNDRLDWTGFEGGKTSRAWRPRSYDDIQNDLKRMDDDEMWAFAVSMAGAALVAALPLLYAVQRKWNKAKAVAAAKASVRDEQKVVNEKLKLIAELKAEEEAAAAEEAKQRRAERDAQRAKERAERKAKADAGEGEEGVAAPGGAGGGGGGGGKGFRCDLCGNKYKSAGQLDQHNNSAAHKKALKEAERAKAKAEGGAKKQKKSAAAAAAAASDSDGDGDGDGAAAAAGDADADAPKAKSKAAAKAAAKNKKKAALAAAAEEVADEAGLSSAAANAADEPDEEMAALRERMKAKLAAAKAKTAGADGAADGAAAAAGKRHKKKKSEADAEADDADADADAGAADDA